ncbi:MAG: TIGR01777 family oxidoreductase [Sulfurimonas sp.]
MKVAITGASGFVGRALQNTFPDNVHINRNDTKEDIVQKLQDVELVINLAGAPIIKRWSPEYKKILISSRVQTTKKLVAAINESDVNYFISTSAIGAYPDNGVYDENFEGYAEDFLGQLTQEWEAAALTCNKPTAIVRFGIVLGKEGGALKQMLTPFKLGIAGIVGDGKTVMSWVDIDDLTNIYQHLAEKQLEGVYNVVAPNPVSNYEYTKTLGSVLHRPTLIPLPEFVLKIIYGEAATVFTGSKEIHPKALLESGYVFKYPTIKESLEHLLG